MKAILITEYGGPENLKVVEVPDPPPAEGRVLVAVRAFGLNRAEVYFRKGVWGDVAKISGIECVGTVLADPSGKLPRGQTVFALMGGLGRTIDGTYAEQVSVPTTNVVAVESTLPWGHLATIPESFATAWTCLFGNLALQRGDTLLVRGATSALGRAAIRLAMDAGATVFGTTRSENRFESLAGLGAIPLLHADELSETLPSEHGHGFDAVLDLIGNSTLLDSLHIVRPDGRVCLAGFLGGGDPLPEFDPLQHMPSGVHLSFFASAFTFGTPDWPLSRIPFQAIVNRAQEHPGSAAPAREFAFEEIQDAHRLMESNAANGKIVVRI